MNPEERGKGRPHMVGSAWRRGIRLAGSTPVRIRGLLLVVMAAAWQKTMSATSGMAHNEAGDLGGNNCGTHHGPDLQRYERGDLPTAQGQAGDRRVRPASHPTDPRMAYTEASGGRLTGSTREPSRHRARGPEIRVSASESRSPDSSAIQPHALPRTESPDMSQGPSGHDTGLRAGRAPTHGEAGAYRRARDEGSSPGAPSLLAYALMACLVYGAVIGGALWTTTGQMPVAWIHAELVTLGVLCSLMETT